MVGREFTSARERLNALQAAQKIFERELGRKCDWDDPEDRAAYLRQRRQDDRELLLIRLAPTRRCPICTNLRLSSTSWVVSKNGKKAVCKSCYWGVFGDTKTATFKASLFAEELRFVIDKVALKAARNRSGVSIGEFARRAGWSRPWQSKLENPNVAPLTISSEAASTILTVLREAGIKTLDMNH